MANAKNIKLIDDNYSRNKNNINNKFSNKIKTQPYILNKKNNLEKYYLNNYKMKDYTKSFGDVNINGKDGKNKDDYLKIKKEKKENDILNKFDSLEESDFIKNELNKKDLDEIIINFISILYKDVDKFLNNKNALIIYKDKINEISNIIVYKNVVNQAKVMEAMNKMATSYNKKELFKRLSNKVDEMRKIKKYKNYKIVNFSKEKEGYTYRESIRRSSKKK